VGLLGDGAVRAIAASNGRRVRPSEVMEKLVRQTLSPDRHLMRSIWTMTRRYVKGSLVEDH
jgi:hypothetical protein